MSNLIQTLSSKHELLKALRKQIWKDIEAYTKKALENLELGNEVIYENISNLLSLEWKVNQQILQVKRIAERIAIKA